MNSFSVKFSTEFCFICITLKIAYELGLFVLLICSNISPLTLYRETVLTIHPFLLSPAKRLKSLVKSQEGNKKFMSNLSRLKEYYSLRLFFLTFGMFARIVSDNFFLRIKSHFLCDRVLELNKKKLLMQNNLTIFLN